MTNETDGAFDWASRRVLVTGGAGFLGSAVCHALAPLGAKLTVFDNFLADGGAHPENLAGTQATLVRGDLRTADLRPVVAGQSVIFNLAAQTGHMRSQREPLEDLAINASAQLRLIEAVRAAAPDAIVVHASTRQVYGRTGGGAVAESVLPAPPDANAVAKLAGEHYWSLEHRVRGQPIVSLRLTNCYGPRQRIRDSAQSFLGYWIGTILREQSFEVWGGAQERDFCFVDDAVAALLAAAATPACHGAVLNVGGHSSATLLALAERLRAATGCAFTVRPMPDAQRRIDVGSFRADDARLRALTGWRPQVGLAQGIAATLDWFRPRAARYL